MATLGTREPRSTRTAIAALLTLAVVLTGAQPAAAVGIIPPTPSVHAACDNATQSPETVIRTWLRVFEEGFATGCTVRGVGSHVVNAALGGYGTAVVEPLPRESQPHHRLYVVVLVGSSRAARYLLDLSADAHGRWQVDLWAEL